MNIRTSSISFLLLFLVSWEGLCQNLEHAHGYVYEDLKGNLKRDKREPGEHVVDIKVIDQFGRKHSDKFLYKTEKFRPAQD